MPAPDPFRTDPGPLAGLVACRGDTADLWRPDELGALWNHQLDADIDFDLGGLEPSLATRLAALRIARDTPARTFRDLLFHAAPDVELLEAVKEFAKAHWHHPESLLPRELALALYHVAVAVARTRCGRSLSSLDEATRSEAIRRLLARDWLDPGTRALLGESLRADAEAGTAEAGQPPQATG